ncbi:MAG: DUF885 domain-containing protein [Oscillospiraceae bacterium]|jgi:uncharacterized protein (DUF885 family)|nr:DUF885 domain-containing protein [Oscillospiraceae bacterium]
MKRRILSLIIAAVLAIGILAGCASNKTEDEKLLEFADQMARSTLETSTVNIHFSLAHPESYGIADIKPTLGTYANDESIADAEAELAQYETELAKVDYGKLTGDGKMLYDYLQASLNAGRAMQGLEFYVEPLSVIGGEQMSIPVLMWNYLLYDKGDAEDYIGLLNDLPRYFEEIAEFEKRRSELGYFMPDASADKIIEQCRAQADVGDDHFLIAAFNSRIENIEGITSDEIEKYQAENMIAMKESYSAAYSRLADDIETLKGTGINDGGVANLDGGKEFYEAKVQTSAGVDKTISEIKAGFESRIVQISTQFMKILALKPNLIDELMTYAPELSGHNEIIDALKNNLLEDFPAPPEVNYWFDNAPEELSENLNPALYIIAPADAYQNNQIVWNIKDESASAQTFSTLAHESYPGHLYQNVSFLDTKPALIRTIPWNVGYVEGWGLYAELYSYKWMTDDKELNELAALNTELTLCLYAIADINVNYESASFDDYLDFWTMYGVDVRGDETILEEFTKMYYDYLTMQPGVYINYAQGYQELRSLRDKYVDKGNMELKDFHSKVIKAGAVPFKMLDDYLDGKYDTAASANAE